MATTPRITDDEDGNVNDTNWWDEFAESMRFDPWDMQAMAERVQEAAAEAALAERERFIERLNGGNKPGSELLNDATEKLNQDLIDDYSYPADPYEIEQIQQVPAKYRWLEGRDPAPLTDKKSTMDKVGKDLGTTLPDGIGSLQGLIQDNHAFTGRVADRFGVYLENMVKVAETQAMMANELSTAVGDMRGLLDAAGKDMRSITDETVTALNAIRDDEHGSSGLMAFAVAAAVIGVLSTVTTGGAAGALAWALVSGSVTVAGRVAAEERISADTVQEVLDQMFDAVDARVEEFDLRERALVTALNRDNGFVDENTHKFDPDTKGQNMYDGVGDLGVAETIVSADLADTYRWATSSVPKLAWQFGRASRNVSTASGTGIDAMGAASQPWEELCTQLRRFSALASNRLYDGGDNLAEAVQDFARQDGIAAAWVREPVEDHEGPAVPDPYTPPDDRPWMDRPKGEWMQ